MTGLAEPRSGSAVGALLGRAASTTAGVVSYAFVLHLAYRDWIAPAFSYSGITYREPSALGLASGVLAALGVALVLPSRVDKVSTFMIWLLFCLVAGPTMMMSHYFGWLTEGGALSLTATVATAFVLLRICASLVSAASLESLRPNLGPAVAGLLLVGLALFIYVYIGATYGLSIRNLSFADVYDVRSDFYEGARGDVVVGYLQAVLTDVLNPLALALGVYGGRPLLVSASVLGQVALYASTGHKSILFSVVLTVALVLWLRRASQPRGATLLWSAMLTVVVGPAVDRLLGSGIWNSFLVRRLIMMPAILTAAYVMVFSDQPKVGLSEVIPGMESPYGEVRPARIVGLLFIGDPGTSANVNFMGYGYLMSGYLGMLLIAGFTGLIIGLADVVSRGLPLLVSCSIFAIPTMSLANSSVFTTLATHGMAAAMLVAFVLPRSNPQ